MVRKSRRLRDSEVIAPARVSNYTKSLSNYSTQDSSEYGFAYENYYGVGDDGFYYGDLISHDNLPPCYPEDIDC